MKSKMSTWPVYRIYVGVSVFVSKVKILRNLKILKCINTSY